MADRRHLLHVKSKDIVEGNPKLPTPDQIEYGEIAINYADGQEKISLKSSTDTIKTISTDEQNENKFALKTTVEEIDATKVDTVEITDMVVKGARDVSNPTVAGITMIDLELNNQSENPIANKAVTNKINEIDDKLNTQLPAIEDAKNDAIDAISQSEQSAISNFNAQKVTPEMLSESTKQLIEASGGGTITNLADDEDIQSVDDGTGTNVLKFADRTYNAENFSGKGYKILRKNIVDGKNVLTQEMVNEENTVYEIRYDFDLNGAEIIVPNNCRLQFNTGSVNNGTLSGNFVTKYPKGTAIYNKCVVEKININDYVDLNAYQNISIDSALNTIINNFKNTVYRSNIDIEFSNGVFYTLNTPISIPARFNLIGSHGNAFIFTSAKFEAPTALVTFTADSDSDGYSNTTQYIRNISFFSSGANNVIAILLQKGNIMLENMTFNGFYRSIKGDAYTDNVIINKIVFSNRRQSQDLPDLIDIEFSKGEGKKFSNISDGATIKLSNGTSFIDNGINLNILACSERLFVNSCIGETGIIHIYSSLVVLENISYVNAALSQTNIITIDDENIKNTYFSSDSDRYGRSNLTIINSSIFNQCFAIPQKEGVSYKAIKNDNNVPIEIIYNSYKQTIFATAGATEGLICKYQQDSFYNIDIKYKIAFYLYAEASEAFYQGLKTYLIDYRTDLSSDYTEARQDITYNYNIVILIDDGRLIGYKLGPKSVTATSNNKFIAIDFRNLTGHDNCYMCIYREDSNGNKVLSKHLMGDNTYGDKAGYYGATKIYDNIYGSGCTDDITNYDTMPNINECTKAEKISSHNIRVYLSTLPQYGTWTNGDEVVIDGDGVYKYYGKWVKTVDLSA